jgi:RHS repeat-associated protein
MGRLSSITYPADPVGWHNTTIVFEPINSPTGEFGLPNKTWKRTVQTGDATGYAVSDTYYDTLWRPLLTREYDSADPTSLRVTRRAFDAGGRERYVSFPTRDAFDPTGNRTARVKDGATEQLSYTNTPATPVFPTDPTYADFSHRLQSVDATPRTYDDVGNTLTGIPELNAQNATSEYDERNRLTRIHSGGIELARYEYNGRGERVAKQTADEAYFYAYDESGQLIGRYVPEGATDLRIDEEILWLDSTPIASVRLDNGQPVIRGIHSDHLNSPRALTSLHGDTQPQGNSVWRWPLTTGEAAGNNAYGTEAPQEDPDGDGTAVVFHLRFPGQQYDGESGLHYNYFRDYEAGTGRYVESDPIGLRGGLATFSYAKQASLNQKDPTGEIAFHSSCDSTQRAMIMISLLEMMSMHWESCVSKPNCNACNCLLAGEAILALSRMNISCNLGYKCASTNGNTRQLWLHPDTARRIDEKPNRPDKCGCLAGTLLHEGMHAQDAYPEMFYEENLVRTEARRCVPCAGNFTESGGPLPR